MFDANNRVPGFVTVIATEPGNKAAALPGRECFSCCIHGLLLTGAARLREEREPSLEEAEVCPSAVQELLGVSGCQHWSSCDPACLLGGVAGFVSQMDTLSPCLLQNWILLGQDPFHEGVQQQEKSRAL